MPFACDPDVKNTALLFCAGDRELTAPVESRSTGPAPVRMRVDWLSVGIACFSILIVVVLWVADEFSVRQKREERVKEVIRANTNLARTFEEHATRTFDYIEEISLLMKKQYEVQGLSFDLQRFFKEMRINPMVIRNVVITDETGTVILGSHGAPRVSLADREHIKIHFGADTNQIFIGKPVLARINKEWSVIMSRRANKPDGSLAGIIAIAVNPSYFSNFYKDLDLGKTGIVTFVGLDGVIRAGSDDQLIDTDLSKSTLLQKAKTDPSGSFIAKGVAVSVSRIYSYRVLRGHPLIVNVSASLDESLADVEEQARIYRLAALLITLVIAVFSVALIVFGLRHQRAAVIARSEHLLEGTNDELRKKAAELASVNQELATFSYSVSHDLRAPLRHIAGFSNILLERNYEQLDPKGRDYLQRIVASGAHMEQLIDDLLNLACIVRQRLSARQVNLSAIAREISDGLMEADPDRRPEVSIAPDLTAWADPGLMRIVMDNLIGNAWKYSAKSAQARIEVGSTNRDGDAVFYVRDNGVGFDMQYAHKLFAPFQRLHGAGEFEGTGIGLATVKRIIERHRGKIWIESALNLGTTVFFMVANQPGVRA